MGRVSGLLALGVLTCWLRLAISAEFEFSQSWNQSFPLQPVFSTIDRPAGKHGHVVARGDQLYFKDGTPVRFWGVGLTFSGSLPPKFPPSKSDAKLLAERIKSLGFNHVRFVGFDNMAPEVFKSWLRSGRLESETMDRFDYFVKELRDAGIYYSLSINNSSLLLLKDIDTVKPNTAAQMPLWRYKALRLFDEMAVDRIVNWYRAFYSHANPYTNLSYAKDPANVYVSSVNEDSIFEPFFAGFSNLDRNLKRSLDEHFQRFLLTHYDTADAIRTAWGSDKGANERPQALTVLGADKLRSSGSQRIADTIAFLIEIDGYAARRIRTALDSLGYQGLFSVTNNWFGYGALAANHDIGNYTDMHGYFDHPRRLRSSPQAEAISGRSYIVGTAEQDAIDGEHSYPLSKAFRAALPDQPLIFSEWGVSGWSPYQYEAPLLMAAYASFQGYAGLDIHTYFNHPNPDPKDPVARTALSVNGNPVLTTLLPSLSMAFRRRDIQSPEDSITHVCADSASDSLARILEYDLGRTGLKCGFRVSEGYVNKVRTVLTGGSKERNPQPGSRNPGAGDSMISSTGELTLKHASRGRPGYFVVDTSRFLGAATEAIGSTIKTTSATYVFHSKGAITLISLDDAPIASSRSILISTASSFRNTGMQVRNLGTLTAVTDSGGAPALLTTADAEIRLHRSVRDRGMLLCAILPESGAVPAGYPRVTDRGELNISIGKAPSPWYWLVEEPSGNCPKTTFAAPGPSYRAPTHTTEATP